MKSIALFQVIIVFCIINSCSPKLIKRSAYETLTKEFLNPTSDAKPKVYWWCLKGNIDTIRAREELRAMKNAGIGGFDLFEIGTPPEDTMISGGPAFLGDESLKTIKFIIDEAGKSGLTVGLNLASSWNAGGSWTEPKNGGKSLYFSKFEIKGNGGQLTVKLPFPEIKFSNKLLVGGTDKPLVPFRENGRPVYYEEVAVLAVPSQFEANSLDTAKIIDLTSFFDPETDILSWEAPNGNWSIHRYVCSNSGQQLVRPSPHSAGLTIDHFDSVAVETHLKYIIERLLPVVGDFRKTALKSFYLASYEARGFVWTSTLPNEFKKANGYNIRKFIPSLFDQNLFSAENTNQVQTDFKKTLSELMINNLYRKSREICNSYGLKINSEAGGPGYPLYNGPAEPLKAQGSLDIPRGEFWINHSRFYQDSKGNDIDILRVVKEVSAASHIYEKGMVEEEAFTSFQHWQEGPFDMKPFGDRAFCEGMNRVVFHGFSHNISGSGFPGYVYHAGTHFNDKRVWWPKAKPFVDYVTRISAVAQKTDFFADVIWYYGDKVPNSATAKNTHFSVGAGYDYEVINTDVLLNKLETKNGKLVLSNGATFSLLVLEDEKSINPEVLKKLKELVEQGAVIIGEKPANISQHVNFLGSDTLGKALLNKLWDDASGKADPGFDVRGKIWSGITPAEMLQALHVLPDIKYAGKESYLLDFIHYKKEDLDVYFVCNTKNDWISRNVGFRLNNKTPEIWDPVSGEIIPVTIFNQEDEYINLPVSLPPFGSLFVVFKKDDPLLHYTEIIGSDQYPPLLKFTKDGTCFLQDGTITMKRQNQSVTIQNENHNFMLDGSWEVSFTKGWGAPEKVIFPKLISWTDSEIEGVKYYSGTASYKKVFQYNPDAETEKGQKIYLDLGDISKVAELWLNGKSLGITWTKPHRFDVTSIVHSGENTLIVEVANTWSNRLTGDALTGERYTNTNIHNTIIPASTIETGDKNHYPWAKVPLIQSGLIGPVTLVKVKPILINKQK